MNRELVRALSMICDSIATPTALRVKTHAQKGEWTDLQKIRISPLDYNDAESYWRDAVVVDFLRKQDIPTDVDKEQASIDVFLKCERKCAETNARLHRFQKEHLYLESETEKRVADFISQWRKKVIFVMGSLPSGLTPRFSTGATYGDKGVLTTIPDKMTSVPTIYSQSVDLLPLWEETSWYRIAHGNRYRRRPMIVDHNVFFTVPKDGSIYRGCCKEASISLSYQLAVGSVFKKRLLATGHDLVKAPTHHRLRAQKASIDGGEATIDLSNASDNIAKNLIRLLCSDEWASLLFSLRASKTKVGTKVYNLEKFSSMGNGFTFELETILFMTLAQTLVESEGGDPRSVSCFGDDLIVPTLHAKGVIAALVYFGFEPNYKKTFSEGPFRESCGGDYFNGTLVRAHFVKELADEPQQMISVINGLKRTCSDENGVLIPSRWIHMLSAWRYLIRTLPDHIRSCRGPAFLGDIVITEEDESLWNQRRLPLNLGGVAYGSPIQVRAYTPIETSRKWDQWSPEVQLASCTLGVDSRKVVGRVQNTLSYRLSWVTANRSNTWLPSPPKGKGNYNTIFAVKTS